MNSEYVRSLDVIRTHCPIDACTWHHDEPTSLGRIVCDVDPNGGLDLESGFRRNQTDRDSRRDAAVAAHCEEHSAAEWAAEVERLRHVVARFEADAAQNDYGIRPHMYLDDASQRARETMRHAMPMPDPAALRRLLEEPS